MSPFWIIFVIVVVALVAGYFALDLSMARRQKRRLEAGKNDGSGPDISRNFQTNASIVESQSNPIRHRFGM